MRLLIIQFIYGKRKQICYPGNIKVKAFLKYSITIIGHSLTFSKIIWPSIKKIQVSASFPLPGLRPQNLSAQAMLWSTFCLEKKVMPAILNKQPFAASHTCSDNGSVKQAK